MNMQEGVLLGVCRSCACSREWIPRQVSLEGVDTLARIQVTATRKKEKGKRTQPGMDVNSQATEGRDNRPGLIVKEKSRPATALGLVPPSSPGNSWRGDLRIG